MISTLESIVHEASKINTLLPNVNALKEALKRAHDWSNKVDRIQVRILAINNFFNERQI